MSPLATPLHRLEDGLSLLVKGNVKEAKSGAEESVSLVLVPGWLVMVPLVSRLPQVRLGVDAR